MLRGHQFFHHVHRARSYSASACRVDFQLDYHLSSQFAGLVVAQHQGLFTKRGLDVSLLAPPPAGEEPTLVARLQEEKGRDALVLGCVEQNTLIAAQLFGKTPIRAVSAMLRATPLAIATAPGRGISALSDLKGKTIAAASDTEEIVRSALAKADPDLVDQVSILAVPRENKLKLYLSGQVDAFQVYTTTEALQLQHELAGEEPVLLPFGEDHGFAQVIFAHVNALDCPVQRNVARAFLDATYDGWDRALSDPEYAAELVVDARTKAGVSNSTAGEGDHSDTYQFQLDSLTALAPYVQPCPSYNIGTIGVKRFMSAADQIASDLKRQSWFVSSDANSDGDCTIPHLLLPSMLIDNTLWPQPELMRTVNAAGGVTLALDGQKIAERRCELVSVRASRFEALYDRKPRLAVVQLETEVEGSLQSTRRREMSPNRFSWLDKHEAGAQMNVEVEDLLLPATATTQQVTAAVRKLNRREDVDGVLVELPDRMRWNAELDTNQLLAAVDASKCVDAMSAESIATLVSDAAAATRTSVLSRPTTPASVMDLLQQAGVPLNGRHAVVIGNSRLCGQPTSLMLQKQGATVSLTTSKTPKDTLELLCGQADVIVAVVGEPGVLPASSVRPGTTVINVGTHFDGSVLVPDLDISKLAGSGHLVSAVPGGVGPNPVTVLFENVVQCAENRAAQITNVNHSPELLTDSAVTQFSQTSGWELIEGEQDRVIRKLFQADSFKSAAMMIGDVAQIANELNHHPLVSIQPVTDLGAAELVCFNNGCKVEFTLRSLDAGGISNLDIELAKGIDKELS